VVVLLEGLVLVGLVLDRKVLHTGRDGVLRVGDLDVHHHAVLGLGERLIGRAGLVLLAVEPPADDLRKLRPRFEGGDAVVQRHQPDALVQQRQEVRPLLVRDGLRHVVENDHVVVPLADVLEEVARVLGQFVVDEVDALEALEHLDEGLFLEPVPAGDDDDLEGLVGVGEPRRRTQHASGEEKQDGASHHAVLSLLCRRFAVGRRRPTRMPPAWNLIWSARGA